MADNPAETPPSDSASENAAPAPGTPRDDFTEFQLREYENISQAHFKTHEVLATFYRYFLLVTAIPITAIGLALVNVSDAEFGTERRLLAYYLFCVSTLLLSVVGVAVIAYIEGLRLDALLYARVVNSIRHFFFRKPGAETFGGAVLPTSRDVPSYDGFGAGSIIYYACALMNSTYFGAGWLALMQDKSTPLQDVKIGGCPLVVALGAWLFLMIAQIGIRGWLIRTKTDQGH